MASIPTWRQIQKENFTCLDELLKFLEWSPTLFNRFSFSPRFSLNIPRRLAMKIEKNNCDDPILRQFVPLNEETLQIPGFSLDPVQDVSFQKTKKILHKYKARALVITTSACAMHCRFCFRQNFPYETKEKGFEEELEYLKNDLSLSEVILSGGDPLSLSDVTLSSLFESLESLPHIRRIRFHSRFPIGIPERIDDSFLKVLASSSKQIYFVIHCNHPRELDPDVIASVAKMRALKVGLLNQSVLLKGVNDDPNTLLTLSESLINAGILPYYLHQLDPVEGAAHFAVPPEVGPELIQHLQARLSGFGVPRLVRETPGLPSKVFVMT